ncbi:laccase-2-like isoform X2 [Patiria miniata]|uniref:Laccase n=1 Tax=Patiria miniata TaxID=46514 RepID=A0A914A6R3_PATMI|nr:laccase-2-like isoform X2 [Patiria miniata]
MSRCGLLLPVIFVTIALGVDALRPVDDNPCYRSCESSFPMTCVYNWTVTWYYAMSPQCGDGSVRCPTNATACSNPGCVSVDGFPRAISVINQAFPGPSIQICTGDEVVINVDNQMTNNEGVTIHWHGLFQNGSQFMDGLPMVTQCPIPSPGKFQYRFTPYEAGTHWYHAHTGLQRGDGVAGSFVIRESSRTNPNAGLYDEDRAEDVIFLNDWHHDIMVSNFEKQNIGGGNVGVDSILINGKGIPLSGSPPFVPIEVFNVQSGTRYRFRVINGANFFCNLQFSVQSHRLLVIAGDGSALESQAVDYFRINGGERYDFVLNANQSIGNYAVRVVGLGSCGDGMLTGRQVASLHYETASTAPMPPSLPNIAQEGTPDIWWKTFPNKSLAEVDHNLKSGPVYMNTGSTPDVQHYIETSFGTRESPIPNQGAKFFPQLNNISYFFPTSPIMSQFDDLPMSLFCNASSFQTGECEGLTQCACVHTIQVELNALVEIVMVNPDSFRVLHPMHLHGLQFQVVAMERMSDATVQSVMQLDQNGEITRNLNGPFKDVVVVPDGGYTIFRFRAWNPGWWIFHCHIEFHLEDGMALLFWMGHTQDFQAIPAGFPTCGVFPPATDPATVPPPLPRADDPQKLDTYHLAWIVPVTFLIAVAIGLLLGCLCRRGASPASVDPGPGTAEYSAQSGAVGVQTAAVST